MALPLITGVDEAVAIGAGAAWEPNANADAAGFSAGVEVPAVEAGVAPKVKPELGAVLVEEGTGSAAGLPPAPNVKLAPPDAADFAASAAPAPAPAPAPNVKLAPPDGAFGASAEVVAALKPPKVVLGL